MDTHINRKSAAKKATAEERGGKREGRERVRGYWLLSKTLVCSLAVKPT